AVRQRHDRAARYLRKGNGAESEALPIAYSEDALAVEFEARHGDELRYIAKYHQWRAWTGTHWRLDDTLKVYDRVRRVCRDAADTAHSSLENSKAAKVAIILSSARTIAAVETIARSDQRRIAATADQWDRDPWLLNTPGGTVDLKSGTLQPHN